MKPDYQVIVAGGGPSGCAAAVAAAEAGAETLLVESDSMLGGAATGALVGPWQTFHSTDGRRIIGGFAQRLVTALERVGASPGHLPDPVGFAPSVTPMDPDWLRLMLHDELERAGVHVLMGRRVVDVETASDRMSGVRVFSGAGERLIAANAFVDATGDADLNALAGAPVEIDPEPQPMSLLFYMDCFDNREAVAYQKSHPDEFHMPEDLSVLDRGFPGAAGFFRHVAEARRAGRLTVPRDRILYFGTTAPGRVVVNTTRMSGFHPLSFQDRAAAMEEGLRQVRELVEFMRAELPGFASARLSRIAARIGVRESRRILGRYFLREEELVGGELFDDAIALGAFPLDIHKADSSLETRGLGSRGFYSIPMRCLLNRKIVNLVTVGKCISVSHEGFSSTRVMPTCTAVGQAGGVAAAQLAAEPDMDPMDRIDRIRERLLSDGAILSV